MRNLAGKEFGGLAQEEKTAGREREGKERRTAAQVHDSFNSKMQCHIKYFLSALHCDICFS